jgi:hypothetical protein
MSTSFADALEIDLCITGVQAKRHHGLRMMDLEQMAVLGEVELVTVSVAKSKRARTQQRVTFICQPGKLAVRERPEWRLRHLAALAEIRRILLATSTNWNLRTLENPRDESGNFISIAIPDAEWMSSIGKVAVEFDAGSHDSVDLLLKIRAYADTTKWQHQWWFAPTIARAETILAVFETSGFDRLFWRVSVVDWL